MGQYIPPIDEGKRLTAAITKTASFNTEWIDLGAGFAPGGLGKPAAGVVKIATADRADTNEAYTFTLQEADADANGAVDAATARAIGVGAVVPSSIDGTNAGIVLARGLITSRFVRLALVASGTTPSINYEAWLGF
jgi:hypothetical protein